MRIGMVSATYDPSVINGAVRMVTLYKQHLEALGHEVTIFTLGDEQDGDREARIVRSPGFRLGDHGYFVGLRYSREAQMLLTKMEVVHCHHQSHHLYHPVLRRMLELVDAGELGDVVHVEATIAMLPPDAGDPRWSLELAGGALMDLGCYGLHALRSLAPWTGGDPEPDAARAGERAGAPGVDEWLDVDLHFPSGATAAVRCSMVHPDRDFSLRIVGTRGEATAPAFVEPNRDDRVLVRTAAGERTEHLGTRTSYTYQLEALSAALRHGSPVPTDADDAVATMTLVDRCYRLAGLPPRPRLRHEPHRVGA